MKFFDINRKIGCCGGSCPEILGKMLINMMGG
jgi:hypothetical protein